MNRVPERIELGDDVVTLSPLTVADADAHLEGEDEQLQRWLSGGVSTAQTVADYLRVVEKRWQHGGPIFGFAIRVGEDRALAGTIDVQLEQDFIPKGTANIAYGLYPPWRGRGLATRAVELSIRFLREYTPVTHALIRAHPLNGPSSAVALRAGFRLARRAEGDEKLDTYERAIGA